MSNFQLPATILVVDDEAANRKLLEALADSTLKCKSAVGASEA